MKLKFSTVTLSIVFLFLIPLKAEKVLKQVVILSRHNVRTPLAKDLDVISPKPWPRWKEKSGYLTAKGALLEGYMGKFFSAWLKSEKLLPDGCPSEEDFFVYANVKQRTLESAKSFVEHGFPLCNITIHHSNSDTDVVFNPVLHNSTEIFKELALEEMNDLLKSLHLNVSYIEMEDILDYKDSELCVKKKFCDLTVDKNKIISVIQNKKPAIDGPLKISKSAVDAFLMEYYEGLPVINVAWGLLRSTTRWKLLMELSKEYHNVIFNTTIVARDIAEPLLKYLAELFTNENKVSLLMGHDANVYTVLKSLKMKPYFLRKQFECTPVGGKIVFQKWFDQENNTDLLKIEYVYQSSRFMRDGREISIKNPPEFVTLELSECKTDTKGFCLWDDFIKFLESIVGVKENQRDAFKYKYEYTPFVIQV